MGEQLSGEGGRCVHLNGNWSSVCRKEWKGGFGSRGWVGAREEVNAFKIIVVIEEDDERGCMGVKVGGCCSEHLLRVLGVFFVYLWKVWCEGWYEERYGVWYHQSSVIGRRLCVKKRGVHGRRGLAIVRQK